MVAYSQPIVFACTSEEEKNAWMENFEKAKRFANSKKIFGTDLIELMEQHPHQEGRAIPDFLETALKLIATNVTTEGIWRINGSKNQINELKTQIDHGKQTIFKKLALN